MGLIVIATAGVVLVSDIGADYGWVSDIWEDKVLGPLFAMSAVSLMFVGFIPNQTPVKRTPSDRLAEATRGAVALLTGAASWYWLKSETKWELGLYQIVALVIMVVTVIAVVVPMTWRTQHQNNRNDNPDSID